MTMQANNDNAATEANNNHKWLLLLTTCLLTVMLNFDATAVNLAVPVIAHQMDAKLATMQWVINALWRPVMSDISPNIADPKNQAII